MDTGGIDERNLSHSDDSHKRKICERMAHHFIKLCGRTKEERAVDLINCHTGVKVEHFMLSHIASGSGIKLLAIYPDIGVLCDTAKEEHHCQEQTDLDSDCEVENHCEKESYHEHRHIPLGVIGHPDNSAPATHIIAHHDQDSCQTSHRNKIYEGHGKEEHYKEHRRMDYTSYRSLSPIGDIGHCPRYGTGDRDSAEDRHHHISQSLADKLCVAICSVARASVSHSGAEKRLYGAEHSDCEGGREKEIY